MKTQLLLLAALISFNAYSITIKTNETFVSKEPAIKADSKKAPLPKSMVRSGKLNIVDLNEKFIMVNINLLEFQQFQFAFLVEYSLLQ